MNDLGRVGAYLALFTQIGVAMLIPLLAGILAGGWLDGFLHTTPILMLVGLFLGMGTGWLVIYRLLARFTSEDR